MNIEQLYTELEELFPQLVDIRRDLHMNPELGFEEVRTPEMIANYLQKLDIDVRTKVGGRGVVGTLCGGKPGKTIALRADFDALPIQDEKEVPYRSTIDGKMHACGHDGHTAALLGVATVLAKNRENLSGNVVFIHQFAEEIPPGGAKPMVEDGALDGVDVVFGAHLQSQLPFGKMSVKEGYQSAAADIFEIKISGKGGHGAFPHHSIDPVLTASQLVVNLQQIVSRNVDPIESGVVTVGALQSGDIGNVIPDTALLKGTVRTYKSDIRDMIEERLKQITEATCVATGASYEIDYLRGYDPVWNHPEETKYIQDVAAEVLGADNVIEAKPSMGGEDFCYYLQEVPGTFFNVGAKLSDADKVYPHHHPRFDFDEKAMVNIGKLFLAAIANIHKL